MSLPYSASCGTMNGWTGMPPWVWAGLWGLVTRLTLVLGAAIGYFVRVLLQVVVAIMAFGTGVLISVLSFDSTALGLLAAFVVTKLGGYHTIHWCHSSHEAMQSANRLRGFHRCRTTRRGCSMAACEQVSSRQDRMYLLRFRFPCATRSRAERQERCDGSTGSAPHGVG